MIRKLIKTKSLHTSIPGKMPLGKLPLGKSRRKNPEKINP